MQTERWQDTIAFIAPATCLVLLHVFVEKSLLALARHLREEGDPLPRQSRGRSKIDSYLDFLRDTRGLEFTEPEEAKLLRRATARIRNDFSHGDWDDIRKSITQINLVEAFRTVSALFQSIEEATWVRNQPEV